MPEFVKVCQKDEIAPGESLRVEIGDHYVSVWNVEGEYHAISDCCPHQGAPLSEGYLDGETVICCWHAWMFNVKTGKNDTFPDLAVPRFGVKIEGDDIFISNKPENLEEGEAV